MRRIRFTIGGILVLVVFLAVAIAALREATDLWESGVFTASLGVLLVSAPLAVHRRDRNRAFWLGFALFGWAYLGASLVPAVESRLLTTKGLAYLDSKVPGRETTLGLALRWLSRNPTPVVGYAYVDGQVLAVDAQGTDRVWSLATGKLLSGPSGTTENFVRTGHSLLALVLAYLGGRLSRRLYGEGGGHFPERTGS
jgi:hypothetical protein